MTTIDHAGRFEQFLRAGGEPAVDLVAFYVRQVGLPTTEAGVRWGVTVTKPGGCWTIRVNAGCQQALNVARLHSGAWQARLLFTGERPPAILRPDAKPGGQRGSRDLPQWTAYLDLDEAHRVLEDRAVPAAVVDLVKAVDQRLLRPSWNQAVVLDEVLRRAERLG